jgi:hypothetical protein
MAEMVLGKKQSWGSQNSVLELVEVYEIRRHTKAIRCRREMELDERILETSLRAEGD